MTPEQRSLITEAIVVELKAMVAAARSAGASPDDITAELDRRRQALRNRAR
jgi:hypothetical protein